MKITGVFLSVAAERPFLSYSPIESPVYGPLVATMGVNRTDLVVWLLPADSPVPRAEVLES